MKPDDPIELGDPNVVRLLRKMTRDGLRASTVMQTRYALRRLMRDTGTPLLDIDEEMIDQHLDRPMTAEYRAVTISNLRRFYDWAYDLELLEVNPMARTKRPRVGRRFPRPISEGDLVVALENAEPTRVLPALLLAAYAGLRAGEIAQLRADDLWFHTEPAMIAIQDGKGGKPGMVPMSNTLRRELAFCDIPKRGWLFPYRNGQAGHIPAHGVSSACNRYLHGLGIPDTLHSLRHRFGTQVLRVSNNLRHAQEALRHASVSSTQIYTKVTDIELAVTVDSVPDARAA